MSCSTEAGDGAGPERGSALVEFALLLPACVLVVMALLHLGGLAILRVDTARAASFLAGMPGVQDGGDLPAGWFATSGGRVHAGAQGAVTLQDDPGSADIYTRADIVQDLEEMARDPVGSYVFRNGTIEYDLDEDRLGPYGRFILDNGLEDNAAQVADMLNGWMSRSRASAACAFRVPFAGLDLATVTSRQNGTLPGTKDRGRHPGEGNGGFAAGVAPGLFGDDPPAAQEGLIPFAAPN